MYLCCNFSFWSGRYRKIKLLLHCNYLKMLFHFQASFTKDYLASIRQGEVNLPDGPLLLNPTSLMNALHREVIEKKPEKFKIACLNDIKTLFAEDHNPFFAGYGNRTNVRIIKFTCTYVLAREVEYKECASLLGARFFTTQSAHVKRVTIAES